MTPLAALQIENQDAIVSGALYALIGLAWAITGIVTGLDRGPDAPPIREQIRPWQAGKTLAVGFIAGLVVYTQDGAASFEAIAAASAVAVPIVDRAFNFVLKPEQGGSPNRGRGKVEPDTLLSSMMGMADALSGFGEMMNDTGTDLKTDSTNDDTPSDRGWCPHGCAPNERCSECHDVRFGSGDTDPPPSDHATPNGPSATTTASNRIRSAEYATLRAVASQFGDISGNGSRAYIVDCLQAKPSGAVHDAFDHVEDSGGGSV